MLQYHLEACFQNDDSWVTHRTCTEDSGTAPTHWHLYKVFQMTHMHAKIYHGKKSFDLTFLSLL